jgi:hypothetical protein
MNMIRYCGGSAAALLLLFSTTAWTHLSPAYRVEVSTQPGALRAGEPVELRFTVHDPSSGAVVSQFQPTHDQLFHIYLAGEDLKYFLHLHARAESGGVLVGSATFPHPGLYRILTEFHPAGAEEQSVVSSLVVGGNEAATPAQGTPAVPSAETISDSGRRITMRIDPEQPVPAAKTLLFFHLEGQEQLEQFEGEWGQMLAVSDDLIDVLRLEPFPAAPAGPDKPVQFNIYFPRPRDYRVWVQLSSHGKLITESFTVSVKPL